VVELSHAVGGENWRALPTLKPAELRVQQTLIPKPGKKKSSA